MTLVVFLCRRRRRAALVDKHLAIISLFLLRLVSANKFKSQARSWARAHTQTKRKFMEIKNKTFVVFTLLTFCSKLFCGNIKIFKWHVLTNMDNKFLSNFAIRFI